MKTVRLHTMRLTMTAAALAATLLVAATGEAADAQRAAQAQQAQAMASDTPAPTEGPRIDRTRPGRRQPAFGLRRLTPPPAQAQTAPNRPM